MHRVATVAAALLIRDARAALTLPTFLSSSMVFPRGVPVPVWGLDAPGATVTITDGGSGAVVNATAAADGRFDATLPAAPASSVPFSVAFASSSGGTATLLDVVRGDLFVCSGQSNMELSIQNAAQVADVLAAADALGPRLRIFQVAMLDEYVNAAAPAANLTASIPWARASAASVPTMSALCYNFGVEAVTAHPEVPVGVLATSWGGVPLQVYMSPAALAACPAAAAPVPLAARVAAAAAPGATRADVALGVAAAAELAFVGGRATPAKPSCLYFSMLAPLLAIPVTSILWYQGVRPRAPRARAESKTCAATLSSPI